MTSNLAHIGETALLLASAYLLGCILGYATRRIFHAGRGTREVTLPRVPVPFDVPPPSRPRSNAVRLAASVREPPPSPVPAVAMARVPERALKDAKPPSLATPRNGVADNLKQIKGIGPKIEASLHAMGIYHLDQIAAWSSANVEWVDAHLAFKGRIFRERWVEQAGDLVRADA